MGVILKSFGHFIPGHTVTNAELAERYGLTQEWIVERTGIEERKYFLDGATSDMVVMAALQCLSTTDVKPAEIDCIIIATMTPDYYCPSTAAIVHQKLATCNACGFDIMAACSGYLYGLQLGSALINAGTYKNILVCGADKMSSCIDPKDRKTVLVLADGAGVSLLQYAETRNDIIDVLCKLDSTHAMDVGIKNGGSYAPLTATNMAGDDYFLRFNNKGIFENGIRLMERAIIALFEKNKVDSGSIDFIVPHQANKRMIEVLAQRLSIPIEKFIINIEHIGNTSAGTIPIAISEALAQRKLKGNERLLLASVGAGFTYAAGLITLNLK
jgi:3-oxoacyl-[acyl-carrier-protein] synthase-3